MLRGGSPLSEGASEPLAKSRIIAADRATRVRARELSKYPKGARHELSSISLLQKDARLMAEATDQDLVLHLVASHHGWCRPFAPAIDDPEPVELTLDADGTKVHVSSQHDLSAFDSGIADRFWQLVERYGWFGLAWLEAILRLADHRRSEDEQRPDFADREPT
jgi:CRISPR-associated endonuclease/helicase Cas3